MAIEVAALALIREHTTVPVPAVDFVDRSRELCIIDHERACYGDPLIEAAYRGYTGPEHQDWVRARLTEVMALFGRRAR